MYGLIYDYLYCTLKNTLCTLTAVLESVIILTTEDFPLISNKKDI